MADLRAGVIGLGMIGGGVAVSLARSGHPAAAVFDVRPEAADGLEGVPACVASPAEVAQACDVVLVAVVDADQARAVLTGDDGVLAGSRPGLTVVLLSTVGLAAVRELADLCAASGVTLLDAGVTNGPEAARNGLVIMVGGPDDEVAAAVPVLEAFSRSVVHCGPLGAGMTTKLVRNAITYATWAAVREATSLAAAGGVGPATLLRVLEQAEDTVGPLLHLQLKAVGYTIAEEQQAWAAGLADKDLAAAQELAAELGLDLPIVAQVRPRMGDVYAGRLG
jgi:3-hydroxyisobutyrate dehydrogenase-like beta-hydroxyacid dehydrogenase